MRFSRPCFIHLFGLAVVLAGMATATPAHAVPYDLAWTGAANDGNNFLTPGNWEGGSFFPWPNSTADAYKEGTYTITLSGNAPNEINGLLLANWFSTTIVAMNHTAGSLTITPYTAEDVSMLSLGRREGTGTYNLSGTGILNTRMISIGTLADGNVGTGTFNLSGGVLAVGSGGISTDATLYVGSATFNFNGGALKANDSFTFAELFSAREVGGVYVKDGGASIDTNGNSVTVAAALRHYAGATTDSLTKSGAGTLTLSATNTYAGNTIVSGGMLAVSNAYLSDSASVLIASDAKIGLNFSGADIVSGLSLGGVWQSDAGTYGSTASGAVYQNDTYFSGTGMLQIVPEPSTLVLLGVGLAGLLCYAWRKRKQ